MNGRLEAPGFWSSDDERRHTIWKELTAVRLVVESCLPHLAGRNVLMHEDNHAICHVLTGLSSRSLDDGRATADVICPVDTHNIHLLRARSIRSPANVWVDRLNTYLDSATTGNSTPSLSRS
eukprot:jgi/Tetstr1/448123/TSEL_035417.t1